MTESINIAIERTGFPVKIGNIELWFDSSLEGLRSFFDVDKITEEKLQEAQEKAKHIHFPDDMDNADEYDTESIDAAFDLQKEYIATQYDVIFGDGTFKRIYEKYPDILALEKVIDPIGIAITEKINEQQADREKDVQIKKEQYLNKKK